VDLAEIQAAYYMVAATGVLVAAVYYVLNMKTTLQTRQAQLFMQIYDRMSQPELSAIINDIRYNMHWKDSNDFWAKYGAETNITEYSRLASAGNYFKGIGVLLKRGLIDKMFIYDLLSSPLKLYWERLGPIILERRRLTSNPNLFAFVDYLYDEMMKIEVEQTAAKTGSTQNHTIH
jgi:hypothetical protein